MSGAVDFIQTEGGVPIRRLWICLLITALCGIVILFPLLSHSSPDNRVLLARDALDPMADLLEPYAGTSIQKIKPLLLPRELPGFDGMALVYGTQAAAYRQKTGSSGYIPLYTATVVIAINRIKNPGHSIRSWKSLLESDAAVLIPHNATEASRLAAIALARALGAKDGDISPAVNAWADLKAQKRLNSQEEYFFRDHEYSYHADSLNKFDAVVMWDYQARMLNRISDSWDIILPADGTLTVDCGMVYGSSSETEYMLRRTKMYLLSEDGRQSIEKAGFSTLTEQEDLSAWKWARLTYNPLFRRLVLREKVYSPASMLERLVLQSFTLLLFCIAARIILRHVPRGLYRTSSLFTLLFLALWMLIGIVKILACSDTMVRYCWYATYVPRHMMPLGWYCMSCVNRSGSLPRKNRLVILGGIAVLLSIFVINNDFHRQVFAFFLEDPAKWDTYYTNQWGYYLSLLWSFSLAAAGIVLLFKGAKTQRQLKQLIYAGCAFIALLAYQALYIAGFRYIIDLDIPTTVSVTILLFILAVQKERFMDASLLAMPIFHKSPYAIAVYGSTGQPAFLNAAMKPILEEYPDISGFIRGQQDEYLSIAVGEKLFQTRIHTLENGYALVMEDITEIRRLERELQDTCRRLEAIRSLLIRKVQEAPELTGKMELERYTLHMNRLFDGKLSAVRMYLREQNQMKILQNPSYAIRRARLLLCICQRRLSFTIRSLESHPILPVELVEKYMSVLVKDAVRLGVDIAFTRDVRGTCTSGVLDAFLESTDSILLYTFDVAGSSLILHLEADDAGMLINAFLSCEDTAPLPNSVMIPEQTAESVCRSGGWIRQEYEEDGLIARLFFPYKEVRNDLV